MPTTKSLLIRADAGTEIGAGHVMRCLALAQAWQNGGGETHLIAAELPQSLEDRLRDCHVTVHRTDDRLDATSVANLAAKLGVSWLVVDGYDFGLGFQRDLHSHGFNVAVIDDFAQMDGWVADLLLDQNLGANPSHYEGLPSSTRSLFGPGYVLLRRDVIEVARDRTDKTPEIVERIVVIFGGSDPAGLTSVALDAIDGAGLDGLEVTAIVGPACPSLDSIGTRADQLGIEVEIVVDPPDYASKLAAADLAVSAAGSTCWELLALGIPAIITAVAANQVSVARGLAQAGAVVDMGPAARWSAADLSRAIRDVAGDLGRRRSMTDFGRRLVDGDGADRVVSVMRAMGVRVEEPAVSSS